MKKQLTVGRLLRGVKREQNAFLLELILVCRVYVGYLEKSAMAFH